MTTSTFSAACRTSEQRADAIYLAMTDIMTLTRAEHLPYTNIEADIFSGLRVFIPGDAVQDWMTAVQIHDITVHAHLSKVPDWHRVTMSAQTPLGTQCTLTYASRRLTCRGSGRYDCAGEILPHEQGCEHSDGDPICRNCAPSSCWQCRDQHDPLGCPDGNR